MELLREVTEQARRTVVDVFNGEGIDTDSPFSPEVPEDLRSWMPDLFDRFPIVLPWEKPKPVDPALHNVWILDNTAFRTPQPGDTRPALAELTDPNVAQAKAVVLADGKAPATQSVRVGSGWEAEFVACVKVMGRSPDAIYDTG